MTSRRVVIPLYFPAVCLAARSHEAVPQLRRQLQTRQPPGQAGEAELELQRLVSAVLRQPHEEDAKAAPFGEAPQAAQVRGGEEAAGVEELGAGGFLDRRGVLPEEAAPAAAHELDDRLRRDIGLEQRLDEGGAGAAADP